MREENGRLGSSPCEWKKFSWNSWPDLSLLHSYMSPTILTPILRLFFILSCIERLDLKERRRRSWQRISRSKGVNCNSRKKREKKEISQEGKTSYNILCTSYLPPQWIRGEGSIATDNTHLILVRMNFDHSLSL